MFGYEFVTEAIAYAARKHDGQYRKDGKTPYISHPMRVCMILRHMFDVDDEEVLAAGALHDVIEDTPTSFEEIEKVFGARVAYWVGLLTKDKRLDADAREKAFCEIFAKCPEEVKLIKMADSYDNYTNAVEDGMEDLAARIVERTKRYIECLGEEMSEELDMAVFLVEYIMDILEDEEYDDVIDNSGDQGPSGQQGPKENSKPHQPSDFAKRYLEALRKATLEGE